jgi:hypothetical protein
MDDVFTDPNDTLSQLTKELKNVSFNLEDIQKTLGSKESQLTKAIQAPGIEKKPEAKPEVKSDLETEASAPLLRTIEKVEEPVQAETTTELKPLIPEEYLEQPDVKEETPASKPAAPQVIQQNLITVEKDAQEQDNKTKANKLDISKATVKVPEVVQQPKRQLDTLEQKPEAIKTSQRLDQIAPASNLVDKFMDTSKVATHEIKNEIVEKISQPREKTTVKTSEEFQVKPIKKQEVPISKNDIVEQKPETIKTPQRPDQKAPTNIVEDFLKTSQPVNRVVEKGENTASVDKAADKRAQEIPKLNVQEERDATKIAQPKLEILNEREQKLTPMNSKDVSLVNIEKTITSLVATMNKNNTQLNNQLTSLHQVATEILRMLPSLAQQQNKPANEAQYSREYKTVNFGKINEFRDLTSNLFASAKPDNAPTLT